MENKNYTVDSIWEPSIKILQSRKGYRFALDSILLAHFLVLNAKEEAIEIGCGNGIILILLSRLRKYKRLVGVEIQNELAELARLNVKENEIRNIEILHQDARQLPNTIPPHSFHLLYSNPPYRKVGTGKLNPSKEKAIARHELKMNLQDLVMLADQFLNDEGRLSVILPSFRETDWMKIIQDHQYSVSSRRYVHSFSDTPPTFVLLTATKGKSSMVELDPLTIYEEPGKYTHEMEALLTRGL